MSAPTTCFKVMHSQSPTPFLASDIEEIPTHFDDLLRSKGLAGNMHGNDQTGKKEEGTCSPVRKLIHTLLTRILGREMTIFTLQLFVEFQPIPRRIHRLLGFGKVFRILRALFSSALQCLRDSRYSSRSSTCPPCFVARRPAQVPLEGRPISADHESPLRSASANPRGLCDRDCGLAPASWSQRGLIQLNRTCRRQIGVVASD